MKNKIKSLAALKKALGPLHRLKKKIVFTNGCFDLLHRGHVEYLEKAASLGDILVIGLNSDASVARLKGPGRPVNAQMDRAIVLAALESIDLITIFGDDTPLGMIKAVRPDVLVKGADWARENIVGKEFVESYGGKVRTVKFVRGYSTSGILSLMKAGR